MRSVKPYTGRKRPISSRYEGKYPSVEMVADDGSIWRGYQLPDGTLGDSILIKPSVQQKERQEHSHQKYLKMKDRQKMINDLTTKAKAGRLSNKDVMDALAILLGAI